MQVGYYALSLFAGTLVAGAVAVIAWKRAVTSVGRSLAVLMAAVFIWSLAAAFEAAVPDAAAKVLLSKIEYLGIATVPVLMFLFALRFLRSGKRLEEDPGRGPLDHPVGDHRPGLHERVAPPHLVGIPLRPAAARDRLLLYDHGDVLLGPRRLLLHPPLRHDGLPAPGLFPVQGRLPQAGPGPPAGLPPALDRQRPLSGRTGRRPQRLRFHADRLRLLRVLPALGDVPAPARRHRAGGPGARHREHGRIAPHPRRGRAAGRHEPGRPQAHRRGRRTGRGRPRGEAPG